MTKIVLSLDADGCMLKGFEQGQDIVIHNQEFIAKVQEEQASIADLSEVITMVGSNRQSLYIDSNNGYMNQTGSFFPLIVELNTALKGTLNKLLLADICMNVPAGTAFDDIIAANSTEAEEKARSSEEYPYYDSYLDVHKISLIYAQIHAIASANPSEHIIFKFYDDKLPILNQLAIYFKEYSVLVPRNVTLTLIQYEGDVAKISTHVEIIGIGQPDEKYADTVRKMAKIAGGIKTDGRVETQKEINRFCLVKPTDLGFNMEDSSPALVQDAAEEEVYAGTATQLNADDALPVDAFLINKQNAADHEFNKSRIQFHAPVTDDPEIDVISSFEGETDDANTSPKSIKEHSNSVVAPSNATGKGYIIAAGLGALLCTGIGVGLTLTGIFAPFGVALIALGVGAAASALVGAGLGASFYFVGHALMDWLGNDEIKIIPASRIPSY